jgi:hypothetical protein
MDVTLENSYFEWLVAQTEDPEVSDPRYTHWSLLRQLHQKEFVWLIANDDNRVEDGRELRYEFSYDTKRRLTPEWHSFPVSVLEMIIALSKRLTFQADGEVRTWFWHLMANLGLDHISDDRYNAKPTTIKVIDQTLETLIWRNYDYSGDGGLFPLSDPKEDQRRVEIWYQMNAYIISTY